MRDLYLIRHGHPDLGGRQRVCLGQSDLPLSERGRRQAEQLAEFFNDHTINAVYHSPLQRCRQTAELLSRGRWPLVFDEGLTELNMGEWDGLSFDVIKERYPQLYEQRGKNPLSVTPPGGESVFQAGTRFNRAMKRITAQSQEAIAVVSHAGVNRLWLCNLLGKPLMENWRIPQPYGGITHLQEEEGAWRVRTLGCMPDPVPNDEDCAWLFERFGTPQRVVEHAVAVAEKALELTGLLEQAGHRGDRELIRASALLHDIARVEPGHSAVGAEWLREWGYPQVADIVAVHHNLPPGDCRRVSEATVVFLADKLVQGTQTVSLEERFAAGREKCRTTQAVEAHNRRYQQASDAKAAIEILIGRQL